MRLPTDQPGPAVARACKRATNAVITVGEFTDANPTIDLGDFSATIAWGDGTISQGTITVAGGVYSVSGGSNGSRSPIVTSPVGQRFPISRP